MKALLLITALAATTAAHASCPQPGPYTSPLSILACQIDQQSHQRQRDQQERMYQKKMIELKEQQIFQHQLDQIERSHNHRFSQRYREYDPDER